MTVTVDYQFQWQGVFQFGAGTSYPVVSVDGLAGLPELRTQDDNRGYIDGMYSGRDFYGARTITFEINTLADETNTVSENYAALKQALAPQQNGQYGQLTSLEFKFPDNVYNYTIYGRVRTNQTIIDPDFTYGFVKSIITIYCPDPRYYGLSHFDDNSAGAITVNNEGNASTCPTIYIHNPVGSGFITFYNTLTSTTQLLYLNFGAETPTYVVVNLLERSILVDNAPSRAVLGNSNWPDISPGITSVNTSGLGGPLIELVWASAYV